MWQRIGWAVALNFVLSAAASGAPSYRVFDLGKIASTPIEDVGDINFAGLVIYNDQGPADPESGLRPGFGVVVQPNGQRMQIDAPDGWASIHLVSVNEGSTIVANTFPQEGKQDLPGSPYIVDANGVVTPVPISPGRDSAELRRINNVGQITGRTGVHNGGLNVVSRAFRTQPLFPPTLEELTPPLANAQSRGLGINDHGKVVGYIDFLDESGHPQMHAFRTEHGDAEGGAGDEIDLGTLPGGQFSFANAVNDAGQIAGESNTGDGSYHAILIEPDDTMRDLGTLGVGNMNVADINNAGHIIGSASGVDHRIPWIWDGSTLLRLDDLIPSDSGWSLFNVGGINDTGQIVGNGLFNGEPHQFRLDPVTVAAVPLPVPWAGGAGLLLIGMAARTFATARGGSSR
jgi:probable HAF family extracellular repeat protein